LFDTTALESETLLPGLFYDLRQVFRANRTQLQVFCPSSLGTTIRTEEKPPIHRAAKKL